MNKQLIFLTVVIGCLLVGFYGITYAHVDPPTMPGWRVHFFGFEKAPLVDGNLAEWAVIPEGQDIILRSEDADLFAPLAVGPARTEKDPSDLAFTIWHAWSPATNMLYFAAQIYDDHHYYTYSGAVGTDYDARHVQDNWELEVDADHSGGIYKAFDNPPPANDAEKRRLENAQAQQYGIGWPSFDAYAVVYNGFSTWMPVPPYTLAGFGWDGGNPVGGAGTLTYEIAVTPWNDIDADGGPNSPNNKIQTLSAGQMVGIEQVVADFEAPVGAAGLDYHYFMVMNDLGGTFRDASKFADGELDPVTPGTGTAVESTTWGRIKASIVK